MRRLLWLFVAFVLPVTAVDVLRAQAISLAGLRSLNHNGAFHGLKHDASGNLYTVFDAHDGVRLLKFSADGSQLLGQAHIGRAGDAGIALDVDSSGFIYIAGTSTSSGSVTGTAGTAFPYRADNTTNSFLACLTPSLALQWLSFVGSGRTAVSGIAVGADAVYVTGGIYAASLPATPDGIQQSPAPNSNGNGFVESFRATTGTLKYATYLTGANGDTQPAAIAVDGSGSAYVVGTTTATGYPTTAALVPVIRYTGLYPVSGFVTRLSPAGDGFVFSTFVPGLGLTSVALDAGNALLLSGNISSGLFPVTVSQQPIAAEVSYQTAVRMALDGSRVLSSTLLAPAEGSLITAGSASRAWVFTSTTAAPPLLPRQSVQTTGNAYAFRLGSGGQVQQSARFGGAPLNNNSSASIPIVEGGVSVENDGSVILAGSITPTLSSDVFATEFYDFPLSRAPNSALPSTVRDALPAAACGGSACSGGAGFMARLEPDVSAAQLALSADNTPSLVLRNVGTADAEGITATGNGYAVASDCGTVLAPGAECSLALSGSAGGTVAIAANNVPVFVTALPASTRAPDAVTVTPHELDFGIVTAASLATRVLTVRNFSTAVQAFASQRIDSSASSFTISQTDTSCTPTGDTVHLSIPANSTCTITLALTPSAASGSDTAVHTAWRIGNYDVAVTGYAQASATSLSASVIDFGRQYVSGIRSPRYLYLSNASDSAQAHATLGSTNTSFTVADECPALLQPHSVCRIRLDYLASSAPSSDALSLTVDGDHVTVLGETLPQPSIAGAATNPNLSLSVASVVFADPVVVTTASTVVQVITVSNAGASAFALTLAITGDYSYTTDCPAALAGRSSCTVGLTFTPSAEGLRNGLLSVAAGSAGTVYVPLSGTGSAILPESNGVSFGDIPLNTPAVAWLKVQHALVSATATSNDPSYKVLLVEDSGYGHGQPAAMAFAPSSAGSCLNCWVGIQFTPAATGTDVATISFAGASAGKATTIVASGNGVPTNGLVLMPMLEDFGTVAVHSTGAPTWFQLTNLAPATVTTAGADLTGDFSATDQVTGATDRRSATLVVGASCLLPVRFNPTLAGTSTGRLTLQTSQGPVSATLAGTGTTDGGVAFRPGELHFDNVPGTSSAQQSIVVTNTSGMTETVGTPTSSDVHFTASHVCAPLSPGASCSIVVTYTPTDSLSSGMLTVPVSSGPAGGESTTSYAVAMTGLYTSETAGLQIVPGEHATVNFGSQAVGTASLNRVLHVNNLTSQAMTLTVTAPRGFAVTPINCGTLPPNGGCDLNVQFTPLTTGNLTGTVLLQGTPVDGSAVRKGLAYLEGYGWGSGSLRITGNVDITGVLHFGQVASGQTATRTVTLTNPATASPGSVVTVRRVLSEAPFLTTTTCGEPLAPGQSCAMTVAYSPTYQVTSETTLATPRMDTSSVVIESDAADAPYFVDLAGQVAPVVTSSPVTVSALQTISLSQGSLVFANTAVGSASPAQTVQVTNTGGLVVHIHGITTSNGFAGTSDCGTLQPGATCSISVRYQPQVAGTNIGALEIVSDSISPLDFISLMGAGAPASVSLSPQYLDYGRVVLGRNSAQSATLTNTGSVAVTVSGVTVSGTDFAVASSSTASKPCPAANGILAAGQTCTVPIMFSPASAGTKRGTLSVATSATPLPLTVALSGVGIQPALTVSPAALDLGTVLLGSSASLSLTLRNVSTGAVNHLGFTASSGFAVTSTCGLTTLAAASSCAVTVTYSPTLAGAAVGALTIDSDDPASPVVVPLTGTGVAVASAGSFTLSVNGGSFGSTAVQQGVAATYSLLVTPQNGFAGTVALTCAPDTRATYAACSLLPPTVTLAAGAQGSTASITSVTAVAFSQVRPGTRLFVACLLPTGLLLLVQRRRRMTAVLLLLFAAGLNGCGSGGDPRLRYTPAGTYTFHVKASSTTGAVLSQDVSLTLTVTPR